MRFGSVASGIEAASAAWGPLGWKAAWFSEIDPFACAVLAHHYPHTHNYGDMTTLPSRIESGEVEAPDVFCGGTPCQAFSIAGKRNSLSDARGNLSLVFCEIADALDSVRRTRGKSPAIVFWENVPGVLSTSDNAFGCFLAGLAGEDTPITPEHCPPAGRSSRYWKWNKATGSHSLSWPVAGCVVGPARTVAWRVTDAQYFGVAQRRRRVFVVASARKGFDPATILFEFDGVRRDTAPSREAGEGTTAGTLRSTDGGSDVDHARSGHIVGALTARAGRDMGQANDDVYGHKLICMAHGQGGAEIGFDRGPTLTCNHEAPIAAYATCVTGNITHTLKAEGFDASEDGTGRGQPIVAHCRDVAQTITSNYGKQPDNSDTAHVLAPVAHSVRLANTSSNGWDIQEEVTHTLDCTAGPDVQSAMQVRRLTPVECERLQGFPDNYTMIPWRKKPAEDCPDGPRYKALGNSWAVPNVRWIGQRIDDHVFGDLLV